MNNTPDFSKEHVLANTGATITKEILDYTRVADYLEKKGRDINNEYARRDIWEIPITTEDVLKEIEKIRKDLDWLQELALKKG